MACILSIQRNPAPVPSGTHGAPTGTDDSILVVELGRMSRGAGEPGHPGAGDVDIHQQVTAVYLVYTG